MTGGIITRRIDLAAGSLALPGGPGCGVALDDALKKYRLDVKAAAQPSPATGRDPAR